MNSKFAKVSLLLGTSLIVFIAGCGPQELNDNVQNISNKDEQAPPTQDMGQGQMPQGQDMGQAPQGQDMGQAPQGQDMGQAPQAGGGCPTGNCEIAPDPDTNRAVRHPDITKAEPVKVIPTGEKQIATDTVNYHTTQHVWQPSERHHTVHKHRNLLRNHFLRIVYHPTFRRLNRVVTSNSASDQTMPTEEVVAPTVDYGCSGVAEPEPQPVAVAVSPCGG